MVKRQNNYIAYMVKAIEKPQKPTMPIWNSEDAMTYAQKLKEYQYNLQLYEKQKFEMTHQCHERFKQDLEDTYNIKHWPPLLRTYIYQRAWQTSFKCQLSIIEENYRQVVQIAKNTLQYFNIHTH